MKKQKTLFSYAERGGTSDRNSLSLSRSEEEWESSDALGWYSIGHIHCPNTTGREDVRIKYCMLTIIITLKIAASIIIASDEMMRATPEITETTPQIRALRKASQT